MAEFDKDEVLSILQHNEVHSPEQSDSKDETRKRSPTQKYFLHVYDHPWRSYTCRKYYDHPWRSEKVNIFILQCIFYLKVVNDRLMSLLPLVEDIAS